MLEPETITRTTKIKKQAPRKLHATGGKCHCHPARLTLYYYLKIWHHVKVRPPVQRVERIVDNMETETRARGAAQETAETSETVTEAEGSEARVGIETETGEGIEVVEVSKRYITL